MSLLERIDAAAGEQEIERGKRLIRAGGDRSASASDWLALRLNRAGLRAIIPFSGGGRRKVRLLTVPKDPIAGDKLAGETLLAGTLSYGNERIPLAALDFADEEVSPGLHDYLHSLAWLRRRDTRQGSPARREDGAAMARCLRARWPQARAASGSVGPAAAVLDRLCTLHPLDPRSRSPRGPVEGARPRSALSGSRRR